jgi:hypothetical protein
MAKLLINSNEVNTNQEPVKFSDDPIYFGVGFKVGTVNWKLFKDTDFITMDGRKFKIKQHIDVGDSTWFLFTSKI